MIKICPKCSEGKKQRKHYQVYRKNDKTAEEFVL